MLRSASAMTFILDSVEDAVSDILAQLKDFKLGKHSAAVLQCELEYVAGGAVAALCAALPYPVVGGVTVTQGSNAGVGDYCMSVIVLTGDDVEFVAAHTAGLKADLNGSVRTACEGIMAGREDKPKLAIVFAPVEYEYPGDAYAEAFADYDVPVFGTEYVSEDILTHQGCVNVCNGECFEDEMTFLLLFGAVEPRFVTAVTSQEHVLPVRGVVTKTNGTMLQEIDGQPAMRFFEKIGIAKNGVPYEGFSYMPLMFRARQADGSPGGVFVRGMVTLDAEGVLCRGRAYEKADVMVGTLDSTEVINSTMDAADTINSLPDVNAAIIFSCIMRRIVSGANPQIESSKVRERLRKDLPYIMGSSGGEICPVTSEGGKQENRFHNYSFIACLL